jgi:phosphate acyltransferase
MSTKLRLTRRHRIAVDAMGGDFAPTEVVLGALDAAASWPIDLILVGRESVVSDEVIRHAGTQPSNIEIVHADEVVEMSDHPLAPLRSKRNSSVRVASKLVAEGKAAAFVSAGNTGATWTSAKRDLKMIAGVQRPALAAIVPSLAPQGFTVLLDVGASVEARPEHLREFAVMGHFYAQMVFSLERPRIGLMSVGEEEGKGNDLTKETFLVLKETGLNFIGNAEGRDIYNGNADVVVCDGFVGNVVLKASEALADMVKKNLATELKANPLRMLGAMLAKSAFTGLKRRVDYSEYGGAPLLGVNGGCIVCHGSSNAKAIRNAIRVAAEFVESDVTGKIRESVSALHRQEAERGLAKVEA